MGLGCSPVCRNLRHPKELCDFLFQPGRRVGAEATKTWRARFPSPRGLQSRVYARACARESTVRVRLLAQSGTKCVTAPINLDRQLMPGNEEEASGAAGRLPGAADQGVIVRLWLLVALAPLTTTEMGPLLAPGGTVTLVPEAAGNVSQPIGGTVPPLLDAVAVTPPPKTTVAELQMLEPAITIPWPGATVVGQKSVRSAGAGGRESRPSRRSRDRRRGCRCC